jgi:hypothetical protein
MNNPGHFTPRPCQNCRDKDRRIAQLEKTMGTDLAAYRELQARLQEAEVRTFGYQAEMARLERGLKSIASNKMKSWGDEFQKGINAMAREAESILKDSDE